MTAAEDKCTHPGCYDSRSDRYVETEQQCKPCRGEGTMHDGNCYHCDGTGSTSSVESSLTPGESGDGDVHPQALQSDTSGAELTLDGPGEEDGPWAPGWNERAFQPVETIVINNVFWATGQEPPGGALPIPPVKEIDAPIVDWTLRGLRIGSRSDPGTMTIKLDRSCLGGMLDSGMTMHINGPVELFRDENGEYVLEAQSNLLLKDKDRTVVATGPKTVPVRNVAELARRILPELRDHLDGGPECHLCEIMFELENYIEADEESR